MQQWLSLSGKAKIPVVQFMRLDVSTGLWWDPEEVGSNTSEGMHVLSRQGQTGKEQMFPFSMSIHKLPVEGITQIKGVYSFLKPGIMCVCSFPASKVWTRPVFIHFKRRRKKNLSKVSPSFLNCSLFTI